MLNKAQIFIIIIILSNYAAITISDSITIPSDKNIPNVPKDLKDFVYTGVSDNPKSVGYSNGKNTEGKTQYIQIPENPIEISRSIIPSKEEYHPGDILAIYVEIKNMGKELEHINIKEFVDDDLEIINTSNNAYILDTLDEISDYKSKINKLYYIDINCEENDNTDHSDILNIKMDCKDYLFNWTYSRANHCVIRDVLKEKMDLDWSNITIDRLKDGENICIRNNNSSEKLNMVFDKKMNYAKLEYNNLVYKIKVNSTAAFQLSNEFDIEIDNLDGKDRVVYWYYVKLRKPGDFHASTIFRYWVKQNSNFLDVDKFSEIKIIRPKPNVDIDINRINLLKNEDEVNITYKITYDDRPIDNIINVDFIDKSTYNEIKQYGNNSFIYLRDFNVGKPITKTIKISYPFEGEYYPPEIIINGDVYPFTKEKIIVETRFGKYANLVALILAIVLFFIGGFSSKTKNNFNFFKNRAKYWNRASDKHKLYLIFILAAPIIYFMTSISVYVIILALLMSYFSILKLISEIGLDDYF